MPSGGEMTAPGNHGRPDPVQITVVLVGSRALTVGHFRIKLARAVILQKQHENVVEPIGLRPVDEVHKGQKTEAVADLV
jgi:hypothetical protein